MLKPKIYFLCYWNERDSDGTDADAIGIHA